MQDEIDHKVLMPKLRLSISIIEKIEKGVKAGYRHASVYAGLHTTLVVG